MGETKSIVCLANSRKHSGRCVAGRELLGDSCGNWVRPVSSRSSAEISADERRYESGELPKLLDIITIPIIGPRPESCQTENFVIDPRHRWEKRGEMSWSDVPRFLDRPAPLWANNDSSYYGLNDRVSEDVASRLTSSLMLIAPQALTIRVATEGAQFGNPRRRIRADFFHLGTNYSLIVTDPVFEKTLLDRPNADYRMHDTYLCISLGETYSDQCRYKLVAAVISRAPL